MLFYPGGLLLFFLRLLIYRMKLVLFFQVSFSPPRSPEALNFFPFPPCPLYPPGLPTGAFYASVGESWSPFPTYVKFFLPTGGALPFSTRILFCRSPYLADLAFCSSFFAFFCGPIVWLKERSSLGPFHCPRKVCFSPYICFSQTEIDAQPFNSSRTSHFSQVKSFLCPAVWHGSSLMAHGRLELTPLSCSPDKTSLPTGPPPAPVFFCPRLLFFNLLMVLFSLPIRSAPQLILLTSGLW